jgi:hypothetical protein
MALVTKGKEYINFYLPTKDKAKLIKYCLKNQITLTECMRVMIVNFLEGLKPKKEEKDDRQ